MASILTLTVTGIRTILMSVTDIQTWRCHHENLCHQRIGLDRQDLEQDRCYRRA